MTEDQRDLETATWGVSVVDAEVKLFLLALIRTGSPEKARKLSGLDEQAAKSAQGWLRQVGVLSTDGSIDGDVLRNAEAENVRLAVLAA